MSSGISMITALTIQGNSEEDLYTTSARDNTTEKWSALLYLLHEGHIHSTVLSTKPVFETQEAAETHMRDLVKEVRSMDLSQQASSQSSQ